MKKKAKEMVSRRVFLSNAGKLIGVGVLTHFTMIGKAAGIPEFLIADSDKQDNDPERAVCTGSTIYTCEGNYKCSATSVHTCNTNTRFDCGSVNFKCNVPSPNTSSCLPVSFNTAFE